MDAHRAQRERGPRPIGDAIHAFLRESGLGLGGLEVRVLRAFEQALEPGLRGKARPVRFQRGTLTVEVGSAALLQELSSFTGEELRRRANAAFPNPPIRRVVYKSRGTA